MSQCKGAVTMWHCMDTQVTSRAFEVHHRETSISQDIVTFPFKHLLSTSTITTHSSPTGTSTQLLSRGLRGVEGGSRDSVPLCCFSFKWIVRRGSRNRTFSTFLGGGGAGMIQRPLSRNQASLPAVRHLHVQYG